MTLNLIRLSPLVAAFHFSGEKMPGTAWSCHPAFLAFFLNPPIRAQFNSSPYSFTALSYTILVVTLSGTPAKSCSMTFLE